MTATAQRLLAEIKTLPPADVAELCESVVQLSSGLRSVPCPPHDQVLEAIHASRGLFAGSRLNEKLLKERARERAREHGVRQR